ncbi:hypothetical protein Intca_2594 [Intrasporangium calvum DSM 43043]|uniref:Zinc-finger domain-containing protein n=1 Tax=Intrasporangium calvum (strain ATCC 23552 / DSM 43043 / JCM 3097 / NBRC 12989 / NCIMB 10167 / NRRL B-3866 / 7 KIP) TaxID=710696 RepID=E6S803_INTC7|nr:hypothetical protein Intca_2594 [Intrasporangium calvum DSM 43043]
MTPHLGGHVRAYVDRALPPAVLHLYDRHLVACMVCRAAADQERRIVASLRSDTGVVPGSLRSSLMNLGASPVPEPPTHAEPRIPLGPLSPLAVRGVRSVDDLFGGAPWGTKLGSRAPFGSASSFGSAMSRPTGPPAPLTTVRPSAPPLHRSPMRAAVVASLAAGASVAAAWGLAVSPLPGGARPPGVRVPAGVASFGVVNYGVVLPSLPASTSPSSTSPASTSPSSTSPSSTSPSSTAAAPAASPATPSASRPATSAGGSSANVVWGRRSAFSVLSTSRSSALTTIWTAPVRISLVSSAQSGP